MYIFFPKSEQFHSSFLCAGNQEAEGERDKAARAHLRVHPDRKAPLPNTACDAEGVCRRVAEVLPVGQRARQNVPAAA